jgi:hypothetical protein
MPKKLPPPEPVEGRLELGALMTTLFTMYELHCGIVREPPPDPVTASCVVPGCNEPVVVLTTVGELDPITLCGTHLAKLDRLHERVQQAARTEREFVQLTFEFAAR